MKNFCDTYNVSRETFSKLESYCQSLQEWQQKFNLVSKNSLNDIWKRHIEDSAQLFEYIPSSAEQLLDIGSGAGFPGMVIAIMAAEKTPYLNITMTDSIMKKTVYLNHVREITGLSNVDILNCRVEKLDRKFDVITARAVAPLDELFVYSSQLLSKNGICIFPKGLSYQDEISVAKQKWNFDIQAFCSKTSEDGKILIVSNIVKKGINDAKNNCSSKS